MQRFTFVRVDGGASRVGLPALGRGAWLLVAGIALFACEGKAKTEDSAEAASDRLLQPGDVTYRGAFRLPADTVEIGGEQLEFWSYSGYAATYYPDGDQSGPDDGAPGSIFAVGHDQTQFVAELSIPAPVISKNTEDLNTARMLQPPLNVIAGMFEYLEIPRAGLAYLPSLSGKGPGKIHYCWGQHHQEGDPSHGWFDPDLGSAEIEGPWRVGGYSNYVTNDYLFEMPANWAAKNAPGARLASGRFRDGEWSGRGPALFAYEPPDEQHPPARGAATKRLVPLLLYGIQQEGAIEITCDEARTMKSFSEADEWSGAAWLEAGDRSAVVFIGTKGLGNTWYGFANGVVFPIEGTVHPDVPDWPYDDRGWWSESVETQMLFFDPNDLAAVAKGEMKSWEPQPYAVLSLDEHLFEPGLDPKRDKQYVLGAACFDRARGLLYIFERLVAEEDERSVVHVFEVSSGKN